MEMLPHVVTDRKLPRSRCIAPIRAQGDVRVLVKKSPDDSARPRSCNGPHQIGSAGGRTNVCAHHARRENLRTISQTHLATRRRGGRVLGGHPRPRVSQTSTPCSPTRGRRPFRIWTSAADLAAICVRSATRARGRQASTAPPLRRHGAQPPAATCCQDFLALGFGGAFDGCSANASLHVRPELPRVSPSSTPRSARAASFQLEPHGATRRLEPRPLRTYSISRHGERSSRGGSSSGALLSPPAYRAHSSVRRDGVAEASALLRPRAGAPACPLTCRLRSSG